jgi:hypothetical protein
MGPSAGGLGGVGVGLAMPLRFRVDLFGGGLHFLGGGVGDILPVGGVGRKAAEDEEDAVLAIENGLGYSEAGESQLCKAALRQTHPFHL